MDGGHRGPLAKWLLTAGLGIAFAAFAALGIWQLQRLEWKRALIARVDSRIHAPAVVPPSREQWSRVDARSDEYRRVRITGEYLSGPDVRVQALTRLGAGWWVLTPLRTSDGSIVLVNRGFVPDNSTATPAEPGTVTVTGLLRITEPGGRVLRDNDPRSGHWYSRDVAAIAEVLGLSGVAPYFIDSDASAGNTTWPLGGMTVVAFRNQHLSYALTWFGLALLVVVAAGMLHLSGRRRPAANNAPA